MNTNQKKLKIPLVPLFFVLLYYCYILLFCWRERSMFVCVYVCMDGCLYVYLVWLFSSRRGLFNLLT